MKKQIIRNGIIVSILILVIFGLYTGRVNDKVIPNRDDIVRYSVENFGDNQLYGIGEKGEIYGFHYKKPEEVIMDESDINYLQIKMRSLIIHKDGSIYIDEEGKLEGKLIGKIEGAIAGDISYGQAAVITSQGQLYMHGIDEYGKEEYNILGTDERKNLNVFESISIPDKVIKVVCTSSQTYLLTDQGDVYMTGHLHNMKYKTFHKVYSDNYIIDICANNETGFALSNDGNVYEFGRAGYFNGGLFQEVEGFSNIEFLSVTGSNGAAVDSNGNIYFFGKNIYKSTGVIEYMKPKKVKRLKGIKGIYCSGIYAYVIKEDTIIAIPYNRQNDISKFIEKYNIFARKK